MSRFISWFLEKTIAEPATTSVESSQSYRPVWMMLSAAILIGAIGYAFTRPALEVFDDLHDSDSDDEELRK